LQIANWKEETSFKLSEKAVSDLQFLTSFPNSCLGTAVRETPFRG
jgi:hypothetical protein